MTTNVANAKQDKTVKQDPESRFYDTVKKKPVNVKLQNGDVIEGLLVWVATYSIGVEVMPSTPPVLVNKGAIATLRGV